jgi:hypothetical protein
MCTLCLVGVSKATPCVLWRDRYDTQGAGFGALHQGKGNLGGKLALGFSYGPSKGNLGGKFSSWGHRLDLEAKAAPLDAPLTYLKGRGGLGVLTKKNPSHQPNCCAPHLSLATAHRRSPAAETIHHKHHAVVLQIQSISPPYLLDQERRRRHCIVRVHLSEAPPLAA